MRLFTFRFLFWLAAFGMPFMAMATHQVGGQIEMRALGDKPGHFRIIVTNYLEDGTSGIRSQGSTGTVGIYRKGDNTRMMTFSVRLTTKEPVVYANTFCAAQRNLNFVVWTYEAIIQLEPGTYTDSQGYYMSYQTRSRNSGLSNITVIPQTTGFTFYLEFPALQQSGQLLSNSSPQFGPINGEYICIGTPFTFAFGGTDSDGDELRYSMETPLDVLGDRGNQNPVSAGPYPAVSWLAGFGANNAISGSPTLSVDAKTGQLSVTATQLGLYVFAVKVEEYRNGVKIGEVRRDFQFLVVDCPPQTTPDPAVQIKNRPTVRTATLCQGDSVILQATLNNDWNYQWRRDGVNLTGATNSTLAVRESGNYSLVVSQKAVCSKVGNSEMVTVRVIAPQAKLFTSGHLCATTGSIELTAVGDSNVTYQWYRDNQALTGQTTDSLRTTEAGRYWVALTEATLGCRTTSDTASLTRSPAVQAVIKSATGFNRICPNDSLSLESSGGFQYVWQQDGSLMKTDPTVTHYAAKTAGTYVVKAIDADGCEGTSDPFVTVQLAPIIVTLDSIPDVCGPNVPVYTLKGSPPGGDYAGSGVTENAFSAKQAGVGVHQVTYTVKAAPECVGTVAARLAVVSPIPTIQLADSLTTYKGNTFTLNPVYSGNPNQFQWASATYLDNASSANPTITSIQDDITYTIDVRNSSGCEVRDTIHITVFAKVWVPDAFTPNGDGVNDNWDLPGIEAFPDAIVTIFNRWGEIVYSSAKGYTNPFDGTLNGTSLPTGVYPYTLYTVPEKPILRGSVMLIR